MMTLQEKLAQITGLQKSNESKSIWEQISVRSLNSAELEKIDYIKVIKDKFSPEKFYGQIVYKDGSSYPKPIQFEKTSIVTLGERIPLKDGTCVGYNYIDYRFKNTTDQDIQLFVWVENKTLYAELRSEKEFPWRYEITEEDHHFQKEGENYYRVSKIYRNKFDRKTNELLEKTLIWDNHSKVMYDFNLIPKELIREI